MDACERGQDWQLACGLLSTMAGAKVEANTITCSAAINACEKGQEWKLASGLLSTMDAGAETFVPNASLHGPKKTMNGKIVHASNDAGRFVA